MFNSSLDDEKAEKKLFCCLYLKFLNANFPSSDSLFSKYIDIVKETILVTV